MNKLFADVSYSSLVKSGEELCGDKVSLVQSDDSTIVVLADGLGSGVKANILATLTSKIAGEMLKNGASIDDVVMTIAETLPVCKVRNLAYSTFTIFQAFHDGTAYLVEYDNPPTFHFDRGTLVPISCNERVINGRLIKESHFTVSTQDTFLFVSDGVIHAGVGGVLNLGWQWDNVAEYASRFLQRDTSSDAMVHYLTDTCKHLYCMEPGDDTTVVCVGFRHAVPVSLLVGPPKDPTNDEEVVKQWYRTEGKKVICGGTSANIVSRLLGRPLRVNLPAEADEEVPPTAEMDGIDLITEGVLTLRKCLMRLKGFAEAESVPKEFPGKDGVSRILQLLLSEATEIHFFVGTAINPAHQNPHFPSDLNIKLRIIDEITEVLRKLGYKTDIKLF